MRAIFQTCYVLSLLLAGQTVMAAVVTYNVDLTIPGEFRIFASASSEDNYGLAFYALPFSANTTSRITSLEQLSPSAVEATNADLNSGSAGFTLLRTKYVALDGSLTICASQDTITPTPHLIRGFGQTASGFSDLGLTLTMSAIQPVWDESLLLAQGSYTGDSSDFMLDVSDEELLANVFADPTGGTVIAAEVRVVGTNGFSYVPPPPVQVPVVISPPPEVQPPPLVLPPQISPQIPTETNYPPTYAPTVVDPPPMTSLPPEVSDPPSESGVVAIDDRGTQVLIDDPRVDIDEDGSLSEGRNLSILRPEIFPGGDYWSSWNLDNLILNRFGWTDGIITTSLTDEVSGGINLRKVIVINGDQTILSGGLLRNSPTLFYDGDTGQVFRYASQNFSGQGAMVTGVPEPGGIVLMLMAVAAFCGARPTRRP